MRELDKQAMGRRVRQIRLSAGLRQWELARLLGTTQSAVHKYEHGVVPEPRRLVELARIGGTSIEWVLTGQHWENGSEDQERPTPDLMETACLFRRISSEGLETLHEALRILREAIGALQGANGAAAADRGTPFGALRDHGDETRKLLESAWRIQRAVLSQVSRDAEQRLDQRRLPVPSGVRGSGREGEGEPPSASTRR